jgi:hypothetical protein
MVTSLIPSSWRNAQSPVATDVGIQDFPQEQILNPTPSVYSVLDSFGPFPSYSLMVGICDDGFPFMLGLDNPRSGSILVVGENNREKSQILRTMSLSASLINRPEEISLCVITNRPNQYADLTKFPNCQAIISPYERAAGEMVIEFSSIVEQRRSGRERGESLMLLIDDFRSINSILSDFDVYLNLKTMVSAGPTSGVWPIISIEPDDVHSSRGQLLRSFGTYIFEKVDNERPYLPENGTINSSDKVYEPNFNVIVGGRLIPISNLLV